MTEELPLSSHTPIPIGYLPVNTFLQVYGSGPLLSAGLVATLQSLPASTQVQTPPSVIRGVVCRSAQLQYFFVDANGVQFYTYPLFQQPNNPGY